MAVKVKERGGKWWVFIDHHGKRKAKCVGSKRAALQVTEKIQAKLTLGQFEIGEEKECRPFDAYFRTWLDTYVRPHCKERTYEAYESAFRVSLLPFFGQKDITEIAREDVKRFVAELSAKELSRSTIKAYIAPLRECLNHAIEDGHLDRNSCQGIIRAPEREG
jgi:integrase